MKKTLLLAGAVACLFFLSVAFAFAQTRITVLPFQNMDGKMELNIWSYKLQDSLTKSLHQLDPAEEHFHIIPADSVEMVLAELNLDPTNPQYASDMWKAVRMLNAEKVVTGNFNIRARKFLINAYVYDVRLRLPAQDHQARDIFKKEADIYESIPIIVESLKPALMGE
ncbi:MAG: hypothetical protein ACLFQX_11645 [Candidatus Kapaibacterium sp.]